MLSKVTGKFKLCDLLTETMLLVLTDLPEPFERFPVLCYMIDSLFFKMFMAECNACENDTVLHFAGNAWIITLLH